MLKRELGDLAALKDPGKRDAVAAAQEKAKAFVGELFKKVPVLDSGARGSTTTFVQRGIGDVLLAWENEAFLAVEELGKDKIEIVVPSVSILAEPPVAVVDKRAAEHGTAEVARAYLEYLYRPRARSWPPGTTTGRASPRPCRPSSSASPSSSWSASTSLRRLEAGPEHPLRRRRRLRLDLPAGALSGAADRHHSHPRHEHMALIRHGQCCPASG